MAATLLTLSNCATVTVTAASSAKITLNHKPASAIVELGSGKYHLISE